MPRRLMPSTCVGAIRPMSSGGITWRRFAQRDDSKPISPLRRRMIEDMTLRKLGEKTQASYIRAVQGLAAWLRRSPDTATAEDLRLYQLYLVQHGISASRIKPRLHSRGFAERRYYLPLPLSGMLYPASTPSLMLSVPVSVAPLALGV